MARKPRTDEELKKIAGELIQNKIYLSDQIKKAEDIPMVFMPLLFMDAEGLKLLQDEGVGYFYEYHDRALPRSIDGLPVFVSFHTLTKDEYKKVYAFEGEARKALEGVLGP